MPSEALRSLLLPRCRLLSASLMPCTRDAFVPSDRGNAAFSCFVCHFVCRKSQQNRARSAPSGFVLRLHFGMPCPARATTFRCADLFRSIPLGASAMQATAMHASSRDSATGAAWPARRGHARRRWTICRFEGTMQRGMRHAAT